MMEIVSFEPVRYLDKVRYSPKEVTLEILGAVFFKMDGVVSKVQFECQLKTCYPIDAIPDLTETTEILREWLADDEPLTSENFPYDIWLKKENGSYLDFSFSRTMPDDRMETLIRSLVSKLATFDFHVTDPESMFNVTEKEAGLRIEDVVTGATIDFQDIPTVSDIDGYLTQVYDHIVHSKPIDGIKISLGELAVIDNPLGYNVIVDLLSQMKDFIEDPDIIKFRK